MTVPSTLDLSTLDLLRRLVAIDTTNPGGDEAACADVLGDLLRAAGAEVEIDRYAPGHVNLTATVRFGDGPVVMLNSHLDVVPAGEGWTSEPFEPVLRDGRLYARGAADAKGSLAAMAGALVDLLAAGTATRGTVVFTAVGDEEVGSTGARALVRNLTADACIVGEPTGLRALAAHKGSLRPVIEVLGRGAHAAAPHNGVNAIVGAALLLDELAAYAEQLRDRVHPLTGSPTLTPVLIEGGQAPNAVPERCRITIDRRMIPGETNESVRAELDEVLASFSARHAPLVARIADLAPSTGGPSETPVDDPFVVSVRRALGDAGESAEVGGLVVNCDMTTFRAAGIPTVVFGPGELDVMHAADENVEIDQVDRARLAYGRMLAAALEDLP